MTTLAARRWRGLAAVLGLAAVAWLTVGITAAALWPTAFLSGWLLLLLLGFLTAFNARKKLPFLPLGTAATWLQTHIYIGILSVVVFGLHVGARVPNGVIEGILALLYVLVAASGFVGLFLSRVLPARLTNRGEAILFERIPILRARLRDEVEALVLRAVTEADSHTIAQLYSERLMPYFAKVRHMPHHLAESPRPVQRLCDEIVAAERFANPVERKILAEIRTRVEAKSDCDYQYSLQSVLKGWLFVHIPLKYSLLLFALVHAVLVHAFVGTVR